MQRNIPISSTIEKKVSNNIPQSKVAKLHYDKILLDHCGMLQSSVADVLQNNYKTHSENQAQMSAYL